MGAVFSRSSFNINNPWILMKGETLVSPFFTLSLDVGGSHITAAAVDVQTGRIKESGKTKKSVDPGSRASEILEAWGGAASSALSGAPRGCGFLGVGAAMPGPFDYDRGIALMQGLGKLEALYGVNVRAFFRGTLNIPEETPVIFRNDAVCFLLGEAWRGAAQGYPDAIGITLGTGFGSAFMRKGEIVDKDAGMPEGGWFYDVPFKDGIADDYFSTRGILRTYREISGGEARDVFQLAREAPDNPSAQKAFQIFGETLGEFLLPWLNSFKPGCVAIGGNIARAWEWFGGDLNKALTDSPVRVDIKPSVLFEDSALLGAALLPVRFKEPGDSNIPEG